jgi:hypothetical protein
VLDTKVLEEVKELAAKAASKILDESPEEGKKVIGFQVAFMHEDGSIAVDMIGYSDPEKLQSRLNVFLFNHVFRNYQNFSHSCFQQYNSEGVVVTINNQEARPLLWKGF